MDNTQITQIADEKQLHVQKQFPAKYYRSNKLRSFVLSIYRSFNSRTTSTFARANVSRLVSATDTMGGGGIDQILNFFFLPLSLHPFATRHDQTRSDPAVGNPVELRNYRATGHTLLSCLACFVLLAFARFTVNSDITHQRSRGGAPWVCELVDC